MTNAELDKVAELQAHGYGVSRITKDLGRSKSSISELISSNKDKRDGVFRANLNSGGPASGERPLEKNSGEIFYWSEVLRYCVKLISFFPSGMMRVMVIVCVAWS